MTLDFDVLCMFLRDSADILKYFELGELQTTSTAAILDILSVKQLITRKLSYFSKYYQYPLKIPM